MLRNEIQQVIKQATGKQAKVEHPVELVFGDYSSNVAMKENLNPEEVVEKLRGNALFEKVEVKAGFINFFISKEYLRKQVGEILAKKEKFGDLNVGDGTKVQVEFISANPTGPLTLGNGRGGFCGDVLANVLTKAGYEVEREYYINDRGEQIKKLGHSVIGDDEAVYKGEYINDIRKELGSFHGRSSTPSSPEKVGEEAAKYILNKMLKFTIKKMGIEYDRWVSEKDLYKKEQAQKIFDDLKKRDLVYEKDGALWFCSAKFGDDKDRVLVKSSGEQTYLASDIIYLKNKKQRGFDKIIYYWGADHHGYVARLKAAAQALGYNKDDIEIILMQLVRLFQDGREVKMSKRAGTYVTLDELLDEVGVDAARYFFLNRANNTHLNFDMNLAKEKSQKNPVYYVQYAHARIAGILKKAEKQTGSNWDDRPSLNQNVKLLNHKKELNLIKQLIKSPEIVEDIVKDYQLQRLPQYAVDVATAFHQFYTECRVLPADAVSTGSGHVLTPELTQARLALVQAAKIVFKNTLDLMGITAPEKM